MAPSFYFSCKSHPAPQKKIGLILNKIISTKRNPTAGGTPKKIGATVKKCIILFSKFTSLILTLVRFAYYTGIFYLISTNQSLASIPEDPTHGLDRGSHSCLYTLISSHSCSQALILLLFPMLSSPESRVLKLVWSYPRFPLPGRSQVTVFFESTCLTPSGRSTL